MKKVCRPLTIDTVKAHRKEDCVHYEGCLEEASALLWPSFSCDGCEQFSAKRNESREFERAASPLGWDM